MIRSFLESCRVFPQLFLFLLFHFYFCAFFSRSFVRSFSWAHIKKRQGRNLYNNIKIYFLLLFLTSYLFVNERTFEMLKSQKCFFGFFGEKRNKTRKDICPGPNLDRSRALSCLSVWFQTDVIAVLGAITFTPETKGKVFFFFFFFFVGGGGGGGGGPEVCSTNQKARSL